MAGSDHLIARVKTLLEYMDEHVPRERWDDERIKRSFATRSPYEILKEGSTHYMGACLDNTLLAGALLKDYVENPQMLIEELYNGDINRPNLHFALLFDYGDEQHSLDFTSKNQVRLLKGDYENPFPFVNTLNVQHVPLEGLDPRKNAYEQFPERFEAISWFDYGGLRKHLISENTQENFERYLRELKDDRQKAEGLPEDYDRSGNRFHLQYRAL